MEISPQRVRTAEFKTVKRGLDADEVRAFLSEVASELERAQNQSTAMEARARAAVARLQEISEGGTATAVATSEPTSATAPADSLTTTTGRRGEVSASVDEVETISRTLLLAQRTADTTVAEAKADADRLARDAKDEAARTIDSTREMSARMLDEARDEARRAGDSERLEVKTEVDSLRARRDFLESDVDHLERHLADERSRLREAATTLLDLTERVPGGLGEVRRPLVSASHDDTPSDVQIPGSGAADDPQTSASTGDGPADGDARGSAAVMSDEDDTAGLVIQTDIADDDFDAPDRDSEPT